MTREISPREGLERVTGVLAGMAPPDEVFVSEHGVRYAVNVKTGHKTGFYIDQRDNCKQVMEHARGGDVLNCFCYTGVFSLAAMHGGANWTHPSSASSGTSDL